MTDDTTKTTGMIVIKCSLYLLHMLSPLTRFRHGVKCHGDIFIAPTFLAMVLL